jgi:hypothetical protein
MVLIQRKKYEYVTRLNVVDLIFQFESVNCKWKKIVDLVNASYKHWPLPKNNVAYKDR